MAISIASCARDVHSELAVPIVSRVFPYSEQVPEHRHLQRLTSQKTATKSSKTGADSERTGTQVSFRTVSAAAHDANASRIRKINLAMEIMQARDEVDGGYLRDMDADTTGITLDEVFDEAVSFLEAQALEKRKRGGTKKEGGKKEKKDGPVGRYAKKSSTYNSGNSATTGETARVTKQRNNFKQVVVEECGTSEGRQCRPSDTDFQPTNLSGASIDEKRVFVQEVEEFLGMW